MHPDSFVDSGTCNLTTLHYKQIREDMIATYKIIFGKYDCAIAPTLVMLRQ